MKDLPAYIDGIKQTYTWVETPATDYTIESVELANATENGYTTATNGYATFTNKYAPGKFCLEVLKVWDDQGNKFNTREDIKVELWRRDKATTDTAAGSVTKVTGFITEVSGTAKDDITLNDDNNWSAMVLGVDKFVGGKEQEYFWKEVTALDGYTLTNAASEVEEIEGVKYIKAKLLHYCDQEMVREW